MQSEKEKMLAGQLYNAMDDELVAERLHARNLLYDINHTRPEESDRRKELLNQLIRTRGAFYIEPPFQCDYGCNIEIGENFYANFGCVVLDVNRVRIGDNVLLGPNVQIYTAGHPTDPVRRLTGLEFGRPVTIGSSVWSAAAPSSVPASPSAITPPSAPAPSLPKTSPTTLSPPAIPAKSSEVCELYYQFAAGFSSTASV